MWAHLLDLGWIGQDSITAVETSRFSDLGGLYSLFSNRLMEGSDFNSNFYRPVTTLSFGLNHLLCRAEPFGYHLVDILILALTCILVFIIAVNAPRQAHSSKYIIISSFFATLVFAMHTIHLTVVPVVARRSEGLLVLFGLAGLALTLRAFKKDGWMRIILLAMAFISLCLSILSKESGLYFLPPVVLVIFFHLRCTSWIKNCLILVAAAFPAFLIGRALMEIREQVLNIPTGHNIIPSVTGTLDFILTPLYPVRFLGFESSIAGRWFPILAGAVAILFLTALLFCFLFHGTRLFKWAVSASTVSCIVVMVLLIIKIAPTPYEAGKSPDEIWLENSILAGLALYYVFLAMGLFTGLSVIKRLLSVKEGPSKIDSVLILSTLIFSAWLIVTLSGRYTFRNSLGVTAAIVILLLFGTDWILCVKSKLQKTAAVLFCIPLLCTVLSIVGFSHVFQRYSEWDDLDKISTSFLNNVIDAANEDGLEGIQTIMVRKIPGGCLFLDRHHKTLTLAGYTNHTILAWFRLRLPMAPEVIVKGKRKLRNPGDKVRITSTRKDSVLNLETVYYK